jgi:enoyl-CoA hydratase
MIATKMSGAPILGRRALLKSAAALGGIAGASWASSAASADSQTDAPDNSGVPITMKDIPASPTAKISVERRGQVVLIGLNRPYIQNRLDPEAFSALARAYYDYDRDPTLRAAVLFGHGEHFSRGIDVDAFKALVGTGKPLIASSGAIDPLAKGKPDLTKPLIVAVHGDTWNMADELFLAADIRIAAANTNFGQDENTHGRFPGGGSTVRFVREAGWDALHADRGSVVGRGSLPNGHGPGGRGLAAGGVRPRH